MTLPIVWLPEANAELREAQARYESIRPELGQRFAEAVADTVDAIAAAPLRFAVVEKERRRGRRATVPLWDIFSRGGNPYCGDFLLSWKAPSETLAITLNLGLVAHSPS